MTDRASTKLYIQHPTEPTIKLVGILEQLEPAKPLEAEVTSSRHKDYLFQRRLAVKLPLDSFRFDFRGNHETGGVWKQGALADDLVDLQAVVDYLKSTYGYVIELLVGHSRGSIVAFRWIATTEDGRKVSAFVNASGRYRMAVQSPAGTVWKEHFAKHGSYTWHVTVARQKIVAKITPEDLQNFYDALIYARALSDRTPGTHTLHLMEDADHNFTGRQDDVVDAIIQWWDLRGAERLRRGSGLLGSRGNYDNK
ncbi:Alpha/Beta hydrolase protein [Flammula alnicola]|nr:Alpha/Beta hydrolase protein [Flammula alnicola]